jgi:type I restriction enzyme S subunit
MYELLNAPYIRWLDSLTYGTKMPRVSPDQVASSFVGLPPHTEQHAIAAFLDRETARIDALVAKKERLIALLQEQRTHECSGNQSQKEPRAGWRASASQRFFAQ